MNTKTQQKTLRMVELAVLLALVFVLQVFGSGFHIGPVSICLVLIPIVVGGMLLGPVGGAVLGFAFGLITLVAGISGVDPFTAILLEAHPIVTACICLGKATFAGLGSALLYRALYRMNRYVAVFVAAAAAPIINTGLFIVGCLIISGTIATNLTVFGFEGSTVPYFLIVGCAGWNFLAEFGLNLILAPAIYRIVLAATGQKPMKSI